MNAKESVGAVGPEPNLFDWFDAQMNAAVEETGIGLGDETRLYLVQLLTERARADRTEHHEITTLAELHARAAGAPPGAQARTYRELGDRALYRAGYFSESLRHQIVGERYYIDMGSTAYWKVDQVFKRWFADAFGVVFAELSDRFVDCVKLLASVRDRNGSPDELLKLYQHWVATGSETTAARLRTRGLVLNRSGLVTD